MLEKIPPTQRDRFFFIRLKSTHPTKDVNSRVNATQFSNISLRFQDTDWCKILNLCNSRFLLEQSYSLDVLLYCLLNVNIFNLIHIPVSPSLRRLYMNK